MSTASSSAASIRPLCRDDDESSALSQFNQSFVISDNQDVSGDPSAYLKTASWKLGDSSDCCSWDGVECDDETGHVIGLDLSSSFLYGSINSSSSLFRLVHLQKLSLADNNFNYSQIPSVFGHLSRLTYINLSYSEFSGQIPSKIFQLSKLISLDLSGNVSSFSELTLLKLEKEPNLNSLLRNLTNLKELNLGLVNISSEILDILANKTSLESLRLRECGLHGEFPMAIFQLPNLQVLDVRSNPYLTGYFPEFNKSSPLKLLKVAETGFFGKLPDSIGNLTHLTRLDISRSHFYGPFPRSISRLRILNILLPITIT
ncbi:hypothetical protein L1049_012452 [Liquidambar formosana]|uniref:Leucine-rich repeat-containing N-terminal plant-type domain-containing protein n=1 Tax=Liquidambar formosana TaxID=63359 RepID=A0AAP0N717_LIQFO